MKNFPLQMGNIKITSPYPKFALKSSFVKIIFILMFSFNLNFFLKAKDVNEPGAKTIEIYKTLSGTNEIVSRGFVLSPGICIPPPGIPNDGIVRDMYTCENGIVTRKGFGQPPSGATDLDFVSISGGDVQTCYVKFYNGSNSTQLLYTFSYTQAVQYPFQFSGIAAGNYWVVLSYDYYPVGSSTLLTDELCQSKLIVTEVPPLAFNISNSACSPNQVCFTTNYTTSQLDNLNWNFGDGFSEGTNSNTTCHTYATPGIYDVTLTYGDAYCQLTKQVTVTSPLALALSTTNVNECRSNNSTSVIANISNGVPPFTYQWQQATGITAGNTASASLNNNTIVNGTYGVTVTDAYGCQATASYAVNMVNCCPGSTITCNSTSKSLTYNNVNISKIYQDVCGTGNVINMAALPNGTAITIYGTLTVNGSYTILNSNLSNGNVNSSVQFGPNAKVEINSGNSLTINNSYFRACQNQMWAGIKLYLGGTLNVINNSIIADAVVAIDGGTPPSGGLLGIGNFTLENSRFFRNWVSLNTPRAPSATSTINGCSFVCDPANSLTGTLLAPHPGKRPAVGLFLNNGSGAYWNVGSVGGQNPNTFDGLNNAIYVFQSNVRVNNNNFRNIRNYNAVNVSSGSAVYCSSTPFTTFGNDVWVQTNSTSGPNAAFLNCDYGVYVTSANATVHANRIDGVTNGIFALSCANRRLHFINNVVSNTNAGITLNTVLGATSNDSVALNVVTTNEPTLTVMNTYGIGHLEPSLTPISCVGCYPLIENNVINHGRYGVFVNMAFGTRIFDNDIIQNNNVVNQFKKSGVFISGSNTVWVTKNTFVGNIGLYDEGGSSLSANRRIGVSSTNSPTTILRENTFNTIGIASEFSGSCATSRLECNVINACSYGVTLRTNGSVGGLINQQGFTNLTHGNLFNGHPINPRFNNPGNFRTFAYGSDGSLSPFRVFGDPLTQEPLLNGASGANGVAITKINSTTNNPWCLASYKSAIISQGDLFTKEIAEGKGDEYNEIGFEESGKYMLERDLYARLSEDNDLLQSKPLFQTFYAEKQAEDIGLIKEYEASVLALTNSGVFEDSLAHDAQLQTATAKNAQISADNLWEQNRKEVNTLYLNTLARGITTFTEPQIQFLYNLASKCPYADGEAVYVARTLYNIVDHTALFNDEDICQTVANFKKEQAKKSLVKEFNVSVSPNPASSVVDIVIKGTEKDLLLTMYNTMGQVVEQKNVNHYIEMQVSGLANGVYTIVFTHKDGNSITERLIINK